MHFRRPCLSARYAKLIARGDVTGDFIENEQRASVLGQQVHVCASRLKDVAACNWASSLISGRCFRHLLDGCCDPPALAGLSTYLERVETLVNAMLSDGGVRLPGSQRETLRATRIRSGIDVEQSLIDEIALAAR